MTEYKFLVGSDTYTFMAKSDGEAMTLCNRQVIDKLDLHPMAWMDTQSPTVFRMASGNFFD
jgi:hypothetical protein